MNNIIRFREQEDICDLIEFLNSSARPKIKDFKIQISCKSHPDVMSGKLTRVEMDEWISKQEKKVTFIVYT